MTSGQAVKYKSSIDCFQQVKDTCPSSTYQLVCRLNCLWLWAASNTVGVQYVQSALHILLLSESGLLRYVAAGCSNKGFRSCCAFCVQVVRNEGAKSLFKGAGANILRAVAGAGVLSGYDQMQVSICT